MQLHAIIIARDPTHFEPIECGTWSNHHINKVEPPGEGIATNIKCLLLVHQQGINLVLIILQGKIFSLLRSPITTPNVVSISPRKLFPATLHQETNSTKIQVQATPQTSGGSLKCYEVFLMSFTVTEQQLMKHNGQIQDLYGWLLMSIQSLLKNKAICC